VQNLGSPVMMERRETGQSVFGTRVWSHRMAFETGFFNRRGEGWICNFLSF